MPRAEIFAAIEAERAYQDEKWGTAFDDKNTANDFGSYLSQYAGDRVTKMGLTPEQQRAGLIKVAAIAVAAIETIDRNGALAPRHYDPAKA
jgi:hypothetical protein